MRYIPVRVGMNGPVKYLSAAPFGVSLRRLVGRYPTLLFESLGEPPRVVVVGAPTPSCEMTTLFVIETGTTKSGKVESRHYRRMETRMMGGGIALPCPKVRKVLPCPRGLTLWVTHHASCIIIIIRPRDRWTE